MKKILLVAGALGALAVPTTAAAGGHTPSAKQLAQKACKTERGDVGKATFRQTYGTGKNHVNAHRNCVKGTISVAKSERSEAQQDCRTEREADIDAFREAYGSNHNKRNAMGKCVSGKVKEALAEVVETRVAASESCREERAADLDAFREQYGTNHNKRNAMGKCVSATAKAMHEAEQTEETTSS